MCAAFSCKLCDKTYHLRRYVYRVRSWMKVMNHPGREYRRVGILEWYNHGCRRKIELNLPDGRHRIRVTYLGYEQGVYQTDHSEKDVVIKLKEKYVNIDQVVVNRYRFASPHE